MFFINHAFLDVPCLFDVVLNCSTLKTPFFLKNLQGVLPPVEAEWGSGSFLLWLRGVNSCLRPPFSVQHCRTSRRFWDEERGASQRGGRRGRHEGRTRKSWFVCLLCSGWWRMWACVCMWVCVRATEAETHPSSLLLPEGCNDLVSFPCSRPHLHVSPPECSCPNLPFLSGLGLLV